MCCNVTPSTNLQQRTKVTTTEKENSIISLCLYLLSFASHLTLLYLFKSQQETPYLLVGSRIKPNQQYYSMNQLHYITILVNVNIHNLQITNNFY